MSATLADLVRRAAQRLHAAIEEPNDAAIDAEVLARHVLGWDRARWLADARNAPPADFNGKFDTLLERRLRGEPVAYLTGVREFWGLDFEVTPAVLIPRPETELLVEAALEVIDTTHARHVVDAGTGSGCVAIALAVERPELHLTATDISSGALEVARRNAARHGVDARITFRNEPLLGRAQPIDLVVSNPPYVSRDDARVMREVRDHEPHTALFAEGGGLDVIRALLAEVAAREPRPPLLFEFGGDAAGVRAAVAASGLSLTRIVPDLAGIPRIAVVEG